MLCPRVAGKIGTVAPPAGPAGRVTHIHGLGLGLNKNSKNMKTRNQDVT